MSCVLTAMAGACFGLLIGAILCAAKENPGDLCPEHEHQPKPKPEEATR